LLHFDAVFNRQKHGQSLEVLDTDLTVQSRKSLQKQCKNYPKKFTVRPKGGGRTVVPPPRKYATVWELV